MDKNELKYKFSVTPNPESIWETSLPSLEKVFAGPESSLQQEGTLNTLQLKTSPQGSWGIRNEILLPFLTIADTTNKLELALVTTLPARNQRE